MGIISAYVMPHPPLAVPEVGGGKENEISETLQAMDEIGKEVARLKPETIIYITPHGPLFADYFHISPGQEAHGNFARFGAAGASYKTEYETKLVTEISRLAKEANFPAGTEGRTDPSLDHGVTVPMHYINKFYTKYKSVCVSQSGLSAEEHFKCGEIIKTAVNHLKLKTVVIASADLSHKLSKESPNGYAPEGEVFDREIMKLLSGGNFNGIVAFDKTLREKAAECGYNSFTILAGCLSDSGSVKPKQLSYECPFGVGYGVVSFTVEDSFRALARRSLECKIETGKAYSLSREENLPPEMTSQKAGAFVSLHIDGQLRGCIGTIAASTASVAEEIIQNAVSAGLYDSRFPPVRADELPRLTYKVDILAAPEDIASMKELDVKQYGVIVQSGHKRGLLLPNLDGVDSVEQQVDIACQKAGIFSRDEKFTMQRFKVTRYE